MKLEDTNNIQFQPDFDHDQGAQEQKCGSKPQGKRKPGFLKLTQL